MAVSANHLDDLVGQVFTGLQDSGLSVENATTSGLSESTALLSTVQAKTTGSPGSLGTSASSETIVSVNDAQDSVVVKVSYGSESLAQTEYVLGFASNAIIIGGNTSNVYAGIIYGTSGPTADYSSLNSGTDAISSMPLAASTDITFSTTGTYTGSTAPAAPPPAAAVTVSGGSYTITANSTTYTAPGTSSTLNDPTSGYNLIESQGNDTITAGAGYDTVFASGAAASVTGGSGHLIFVSGSGNYAAGSGSGTDTLYGGSGMDSFTGGAAGNSVLVAGTGNTTLSGGNADVMFGGSGSTTFNGSVKGGDIMVGGTGQNVFNMTSGDAAFGASGMDSFNTGAGTAIVVEGSGQETATFGAGSAYVFEGTGIDSITVVAGMKGTDGIVGFKVSDHITLKGYTNAQLQAALSTASTGSFGTAITFADGTKLVAYNVQALNTGQFSIG
ncbi:MAG: calcium-binding protein [Janthinobacterium lividum]